MKYLYLALAIVLEVLGSSLLNTSEGFTKWIPASIALISYTICFYFLSLSLKYFPLGFAYAIWAGLGIVLTAFVSVLIFKEALNTPVVIGIVLIVSGILVMNYDAIMEYL